MPSFAFSIATTLGVFLISNILASFLLGVLIVQAYIFFTRFHHDKIKIKALVMGLGLCELAHSICSCGLVYAETVSNYGDPASLVKMPIWGPLTLYIGSIIDLVAQLFFANRIRNFVKDVHNLPAHGLTLISFVRFGLAFANTTLSASVPTPKFLSEHRKLLLFLLSIRFATDMVVSLSLLYYLAVFQGIMQRKGRKSAPHGTPWVVDNIIAWTIRTGFITAVVDLSLLTCHRVTDHNIQFLVMPKNYVWLSIYIFLPKLSSISVLSSLNSRTQQVTDTDRDASNSIQWSDLRTPQREMVTTESLPDIQNKDVKKLAGLTPED